MVISPDEFRDSLRHFAAGVTLVTARRGDVVHGMTVSAFASVSIAPPLVTVIIDRGGTIQPLLEKEGATFAISILGEEQAELSDRFAFGRGEERFQKGSWSAAPSGAPVLDDGLAWLDCSVEARHPAGTHVIYVGRVRASRVIRPGHRPLVYWDRAYRRVEPLGEGDREASGGAASR